MLQSQRGDRPTDHLSSVLSQHAAELYDDSRLNPLLQQLIRTSCRLGDAMGGSVSLVDGVEGSYTKVAEVGTACRLGQSFPLNEGVTGEVLRRRSPVVLRTYRDLQSGHLRAGNPAADGAVVAIPVWWRADIVAVNVIFAGVARAFSAGEVDHLELITQVVAAGLVSAVERELPGHSSGRREAPILVSSTDARTQRAMDSVADVVSGLIELTQWTEPQGASPAAGLQVRLVADADKPRLLFRSEVASASAPSASWHEIVDTADGMVAVRTLDNVDPTVRYLQMDRATVSSVAGANSPFTSREREVANLLSRGLSDRMIANELFLSPKTVEKHVSAVLRKTTTTSRTAAVVRCLSLGWV